MRSPRSCSVGLVILLATPLCVVREASPAAWDFAAQEPAPAASDFARYEPAAKRRVLDDIAASRSNFSITEVVDLVRVGLRADAPDVRVSALAAIAGRAAASTAASPAAGQIRPAWQDDAKVLRSAIYEECVALLKTDPDARVREYALLAVGHLGMSNREQPLSGELVGLLISVYRTDRASRVRSRVMHAFRLAPTESAAVRAVLRDGLVDPAADVRHEALMAISPEATGGRIRIQFEDARTTLERALDAADPGVRLGAVRALNVFGAPSRVYLPVLERMRDSDPNPEVRVSAQLAIEAIQRASR